MDPESEVRRVAHEVLGRIVSGAYPAGLRLPAENDLAVELACGRSTVREALRHLAGLGVVKSRRGSGAMVLDFRREGTPGLLPWYVVAGRFDRPIGVLARELLGMRTVLAAQAVRLAARYAEAPAIAEARAILARAPALAGDAAAHGSNELDLFRALVTGSGIWPAVWLANVFWGPMRELHDRLAGVVGAVPADYQEQMTRLLDLIEKHDDVRAEAHVVAWFARVDDTLVPNLEQLLGFASAMHAPAPALSPSSSAPRAAEPEAPRAHAAHASAPILRTSKRKAVKR
jgi:GntR family transcriptional regulator, transcriptional repressor for pyruvate dehydrogenase complex